MATPVLGSGEIHPNSVGHIASRTASIRPATVWGMLLLRYLRGGVAVPVRYRFWLAGQVDPWRQAADWWLAWLALGEFFNLWLLARLAHGEGLRLRDLYGRTSGDRRRDLKWLLVALLVAGPVGYLPNVLLGGLLWGDAGVGAELSFRALPLGAALAILLVFPVIHALTELPTYFGYVMPRLQAWPDSGPFLCFSALSCSRLNMFSCRFYSIGDSSFGGFSCFCPSLCGSAGLSTEDPPCCPIWL